MLDFVPNHVGLDHPWVRQRPDLFVQSPAEVPGTFAQQTRAGVRWLAHGKDPYFAPWTDTVQLDYRRAATRAAMTQLLQSVAAALRRRPLRHGHAGAQRCLRQDLGAAPCFQRGGASTPAGSGLRPTTGQTRAYRSRARHTRAGVLGLGDSAVREDHPGFLFLAEAYWGLEARLQALGFDYTYDKTLYDGLVTRDARGSPASLAGDERGSRRAGAPTSWRTTTSRASLPFCRRRNTARRLCSFWACRECGFCMTASSPGHAARFRCNWRAALGNQGRPRLANLYEQLLTTLPGTAVGQGRGELLKPRVAWPDNPTAQNFVVVQWQRRAPEFDLVVVNLAPHRSQCYAPLTIQHLAAHNWAMRDLLGQEYYKRSGDDLQNQGLYLDLPGPRRPVVPL